MQRCLTTINILVAIFDAEAGCGPEPQRQEVQTIGCWTEQHHATTLGATHGAAKGTKYGERTGTFHSIALNMWACATA